MILHQLRWEMGDTAFFLALKNYINDPQLRFGFSKTDDLIGYFNRASGKNWDGYFDDWLYGQGVPLYSVQFQQRGSKIISRFVQSTTHSSVSLFEQKLKVRWYNESKTDSVDQVVEIRQNDQSFEFMAPFVVASAVIDPDFLSIQRTIKVEPVYSDVPVVYPNPMRDQFEIAWAPPTATEGQVRVYNALGQVVLQQTWWLRSCTRVWPNWPLQGIFGCGCPEFFCFFPSHLGKKMSFVEGTKFRFHSLFLALF